MDKIPIAMPLSGSRLLASDIEKKGCLVEPGRSLVGTEEVANIRRPNISLDVPQLLRSDPDRHP